MPTSTATSTTNTLLRLQGAVTNAAQTLSNNFLASYFANLGWLDFLSILISLAIFGAIIYIIIETGYVRTRVDRIRDVVLKTDISKKHTQESWGKIQRHFYKGDENDLKVAIIEADKLLNEALRNAGVLGSQLGDRLKRARPGQIPNLDDIWQAHKLRNQIAHESDFKLKRDLAERALSIYETALQNLGALGENQNK